MLSIRKSPLPRGRSYILKTSTLQEALREAELEINVSLTHGMGQAFWVSWLQPNDRIPHERWMIYAGSVPSGHAFAARRYTEQHILPEMVTWIQQMLSLPHQSPLRQPRVKREFPLPAEFKE